MTIPAVESTEPEPSDSEPEEQISSVGGSSTPVELPFAPLRAAGVLLLAIGAASVLLAWPIWSYGGVWGVVGLVFAALLCLIPGWVVFLFVSLYRGEDTQTVMVLAGSGLRFLTAMGGAYLSYTVFPQLRSLMFLGCVVLMYLVALGVETWLILVQPLLQKRDAPSHPQVSSRSVT